MLSQTIVTDGVQLWITATSPKKPKVFASILELSAFIKKLKINGEVERTVTDVLGVDVGERFPIAAVAINVKTGRKKRWTVGRGSFHESKNNTDRELDALKHQHDIQKEEAKLGKSSTKLSYDLGQFHSGYFAAWLSTREKMTTFYSHKRIRHLQFNNYINQQRHYDRLTSILIKMIGAHHKNHPENRKKLVVIGLPSYTARKNTAPSRSTTFWEHFCRKVILFVLFLCYNLDVYYDIMNVPGNLLWYPSSIHRGERQFYGMLGVFQLYRAHRCERPPSQPLL
jgi:hypothetical protein